MEHPPGAEKKTAGASPTRLELIDHAARRLTAADRSAPRRTAEWLLTELLGCDRAHLYAHPDRTVASSAARQFREMVERRVQGEPLQHILGYASFHGLRVRVSPDVMVPRPETEIVVDRALACLEAVSSPQVLDVGTGSGCIALALKHERPDAEVHACDVSTDALGVARDNAQDLDLDVQFFNGDLRSEAPDAAPRDVDLLVSNPPYIPDAEAGSLPPVVREYDPDQSLFAGSDPLRFYRALVGWTEVLCAPGGSFVFEVHAEYAAAVEGLFRGEGTVEAVHTEEDLSGRPRIVWGRTERAKTS
ncbi:peptide chain release factor N(5)-glutamine methyltransferase [Salinibacter altiplanensis]|uniref:peptide chain release factor N(5)-glutamine methyltransferase n=1 Tax=Salinibacter altiplanensis TaxID=1803181 RepID=UPI000C9FCC00|nr:peptide chain release factor N(5)-glutamine methyltransferase [Salinibacter altiplanensis]